MMNSTTSKSQKD